MKAYDQQAYDTYLMYAKKFNEIHPSHPSMLYNLASAYALNGMSKEAISTLRSALFINKDLAFEQDSDFNSLMNLPEYQELLEFQKKQNEKRATGETLVIKDSSLVHAESIAFIPGSQGNLLIGTVRNPGVYRCNIKTRECSSIMPYDPENSFYAFTSVNYDINNKLIWLTATALPEVKNYTEKYSKHNKIFAITLKGDIVSEYTFYDHQFQDLILIQGIIYISDSYQNKVFTLEKTGELKEFIDLSKHAFSLQSMAFNSEKNILYVSDYIRGIYSIDLSTLAFKILSFAENPLILKGIDGLEYDKGNLYAMHNGTNPSKVVRYVLGESGIDSYEIIEQNIITSGEPTTASIYQGTLYYIANSPWDAYEKGLWNAEKAGALEIRKINLNE
jgi:hypothetical protein